MIQNKQEVIVGLDIGTTKVVAIAGVKNEFGKIEEYLKWGAPSYVTHTSSSGSTLIEVFLLLYLDFSYNKKC